MMIRSNIFVYKYIVIHYFYYKLKLHLNYLSLQFHENSCKLKIADINSMHELPDKISMSC
jgi:UDP-N-acetylglucosamine pyrophosphorylase